MTHAKETKHAEETHHVRQPSLRDASIDRWRRHYERDRRAFERTHDRPPQTHYELARWLAEKP